MRVLVVDDDRLTRQLIASLLKLVLKVDVREADNGDDALLAVQSDTFDLLLLDWDMPGKTGLETFNVLKNRQSPIPTIMVSSNSRPEMVLEALQAGISDYIIKPFQPEYLLGKVGKFKDNPSIPRTNSDGEAEAEISKDGDKLPLNTILNRLDDISTIPQMAAQFMAVTNDPEATVDKLEEVLSHDPVLATQVLRLVNSSAFGLRRVTSLRKAVSYLGLKQIRNLGVTLSVSPLFRSHNSLRTYNRTGLWHHMVSVAIGSRLIAKRMSLPDFEDFFLPGLLHDIGIVLEDQYAHQQFCQIVRSLVPGMLLVDLEQEYFAFDHATLGSHVAEKWKFPQAVRAAILYHHNPMVYDGQDQLTVRTVALANALCSLQGSTSVGINLVKALSPKVLGLPFGEQDLVLLIQEVNAELAKSGSILDT